MPTEFSIDNINDYFTKLNPIAAKISLDIDETKSAYEHIWAKLNHNEHNEIINETLMKPEISLRYFDNFSIATSASSLSLSSIVTPSQSEEVNKKHATQLNHHQSHNFGTRRFYDFDGRNLATYAEQKIGLKLIHDEIFGTFRDGHSMPFSYKTKSQINLRLFPDEETKQSQTKNPKGEILSNPIKMKNPKVAPEAHALQISVEIFKKLHTELATNLSNRNKIECLITNSVHVAPDLKSFDKTDTKYQRFYDECVTVAPDGGVGNQAPNQPELSLLKYISKNGKPTATKFNHSKYGYDGNTRDCDDMFETVNLMMNCYNNSTCGMTTSSSSAPSEDEEKTLCEDLKLLIDNDNGLRKGFDFLNNW